jgi:hypothetical protein
VAVTTAGFASWLIRSSVVRVAACAVVVLVAATVTVYELPQVMPGFSVRALAHPFSGSRQSLSVLAEDLKRDHVTIGYAGYWVAYELDFEARGSLHFTPSPPGLVRNEAYLQAADASAHPAWIVCMADEFAACKKVLGHAAVDPVGVTVGSLEAWLGSHHIQFSIVSGEGFEVVVPESRVTPAMLGT